MPPGALPLIEEESQATSWIPGPVAVPLGVNFRAEFGKRLGHRTEEQMGKF